MPKSRNKAYYYYYERRRRLKKFPIRVECKNSWPFKKNNIVYPRASILCTIADYVALAVVGWEHFQNEFLPFRFKSICAFFVCSSAEAWSYYKQGKNRNRRLFRHHQSAAGSIYLEFHKYGISHFWVQSLICTIILKIKPVI